MTLFLRVPSVLKGTTMIKKILLLLIYVLISTSLYAIDFEETKDACKKGDAKACYTLGNIYEYGKNIKADEKKAIFFYKKACKLKNTDACESIERIQEENMVGGC